MNNNEWGVVVMKGVPKRDGSGKGRRLNKGRGGCSILRRGFNRFFRRGRD